MTNTTPPSVIARTMGLTLLLFPVLATLAPAETFPGEVTRFSPNTSQPIFPVGNINIFKQYVIGAKFDETVGANTSINLLFDTLHFGGELQAGVEAAFGFEVGMCLGGNSTYDLGFQPVVTLPDKYPFDFPIPLTISEGLLPDSKFQTEFPPLGKAYADLIVDVGANLRASACIGGCFDVIDFGFSTCDIPALQPSGVKLFKESVRCDPFLTAEKYCAIELASFNRENDNTLRMINVGADNVAEFLAEPYKEFAPLSSSPGTFRYEAATKELFVTGASPVRSDIKNGAAVQVSTTGTLPSGLDPSRIYYVSQAMEEVSPSNPKGVFFKLATGPGGPLIQISSAGSGTHQIIAFEPDTPDEPLLGGYGTLTMAVPTVATSSEDSAYNTAKVLRSSNAETVFGIGIDIAAMVDDFLIPPPIPPLSANGSLGPVAWNYSLASVEAGPAIDLQTDFEMTWDLEVTEMAFTDPENSLVGRPVQVIRLGQPIIETTLFTPAPGSTHLTNCGPKALPMIQLMNMDPVEVTIQYTLKPKLRTIVNLPIVGQLDYAFLSAGASVDYGFGTFGLGFGPLLEDSHRFKVGEFTVYDGDPFEIDGATLPGGAAKTGSISIQMEAAGPPSFEWKPSQLALTSRDWTARVSNVTNWAEVIDPENPQSNSFPGDNGTSSSHAFIGVAPTPRLSGGLSVDSLKIAEFQGLSIFRSSSFTPPAGVLPVPELVVAGGLVENCGEIQLIGGEEDGSLVLDDPNAVLCGPGTVVLTRGATGSSPSLKGFSGPDFTFSNYNTIRGTGAAMSQTSVNDDSELNNIGAFIGDPGFSSERAFLFTSFNRIRNQGDFKAVENGRFSAAGDSLTSSSGSLSESCGANSTVFLSFAEVEHAGLVRACEGGTVDLSPRSTPRSEWNAGQAMTNDVGFFRAEGAGSRLVMNNIDMGGGCIFLGEGGSLESNTSNFTGSVFHVGDFNGSTIDESSGLMNLSGSGHVFSDVCLTNNGTLSVNGDVEFIDNRLFANNGRINVPAGASLMIRMESNDTPGASDETGRLPGMANATAIRRNVINRGTPEETIVETNGALLGGTWDISGSLEIEGAAFAVIGANSGAASTPTGTVDSDGTVTGTTEAGLDRVLSLGNPADVRLRNSDWSFPAIESLLENRGSFLLSDGAIFPSPSSPNTTTPGDFLNQGHLEIGFACEMRLGGSFRQIGRDSVTILDGSAVLSSPTQQFEILGGTVTVDDASFFNLSGGTVTSGTSILVRAPLTDTGEINPFTGFAVSEQEPVVISLTNPITSIAAGASVELHGRTTISPGSEGIHFPALTENLTSNSGSFTLTGDGFPYSPEVQLSGLVNTGQVVVQGSGTKLNFNSGAYIQNGADSSIRIGSGAAVAFDSNAEINNGEVVVEIAARSPYGWFAEGDVQVGAGFFKRAPGDLNNRLVIDFTGELAESSVDIGDTWEIAPRTNTIDGLDNVTFLLDGAAIPSDWLPSGSELVIVQFPSGGTTSTDNKGLAIRVAPVGGFTDYYTWASDRGLPNRMTTVLADPAQDGNDNGISNELEFFFGLDGATRTSAGQFIEERVQTAEDGGKFFEISYVRTAGIDASYTPFLSSDLGEWSLAPMKILSVGPGPAADLERVTLRSTFPITEEQMFFRVQANFNPDNFDAGLLPVTLNSKYITFNGPLNNFDGELQQFGADYLVVPGRVIYFNVNANPENLNSVVGGTAPNGVDRNFIYQDFSPLEGAVVHAGLLSGNGGRGIIKVTFVETPAGGFMGSEQTDLDGNTVESRDGNAGSAPYSYKVELERSFTD